MGDKIENWRRWAELACQDCGNAILSRDMFLSLHEMIQKNPVMQVADYFHEYMRDTYIAHVTMMLRKHAKVSKDSISLLGLARDLSDNIGQVQNISVADSFELNIQNFIESTKKVEAFADRVVAHQDRRAPCYVPTYDDIDKAIEAMDNLSVQCSSMVGGDYADTCKPTVQYGWLRIFSDMGIET